MYNDDFPSLQISFDISTMSSCINFPRKSRYMRSKNKIAGKQGNNYELENKGGHRYLQT